MKSIFVIATLVQFSLAVASLHFLQVNKVQNPSSKDHTRQASADSYLITPRPSDVKRH